MFGDAQRPQGAYENMLAKSILRFRTVAPTAAAPQTTPLPGAVTFKISDVEPEQYLQKG
jgi:hypothetical protein